MISAIKLSRFSGRAIWSGLDAGSTPLSALLTTAGLVRVLGVREYGILVILLSISALSAAISPAIAATTTKFVAEAYANEKSGGRSFAQLITASFSIVVAADLFFLTITTLFSGRIAILLFNEEVLAAFPDLSTALSLAVVTVCIQQLDTVAAAAIRGLEKFRAQALFEFFSKMVTAATIIVVARATHSIVIILISQIAVCATSLFLRTRLLDFLHMRQGVFALPEKTQFVRVIKFGSWMWIYAVAAAAYSMDRVLIGRLLGPSAAAEYNVYLQITQLVHYIPSSLFAFLFPAFSRMSAQIGQTGRLNVAQTYQKFRRFITATSVTAALLLLVFRHPLVHIFAGTAFAGIHEACYLLLLGSFLLMAFNIAPYFLLLGHGASRRVSIITTSSAIATLVLVVPLTSALGLTGSALARYAYVCGTLLLLLHARRLLNAKDADCPL